MKTGCSWRPTVVGMVLSALAALSGPTVVRADQTDDLIARISSQTTNRAEAAKKLLAAAESLKDLPAAQIRLWVKACEYGMTSRTGYPTVIEALDSLERAAPDKISTWRKQRLDVYRQQYYRGARADRAANGEVLVEALLAEGARNGEAGDRAGAAKHYRQAYGVARAVNLSNIREILDKARAAENLVAVHARIAALKGTIAKNPAASAARERLVMMYLVDLDKPGEAAKYLGQGLHPTLQANVSMAAKEAAQLKDENLLTLGKWYKTLVPRAATKDVKANLLTRARDNLRMYLEVHTKQDISRLDAAGALKAVDAQLTALSAPDESGTSGVSPRPTPYGSRWVNMLAEVNPARHGVNGQWVRRGSGVIGAGRKHTMVTVPVTASGSYDLQTVFTLVEGHVVNVTVPIGRGQAAIILGGARGTTILIERVGNKNNNPTKRELPGGARWFPIGARTAFNVSVRVRGETAHVTASLNGTKVIDWTGLHARLNVGSFWGAPVRTFAFGTRGGTVMVHSAKVRLLDAADGDIAWISKDASLKLSSVLKRTSPPKGFLSGTGRLTGGWGIHTEAEVNPHMTVVLGRTCDIKRILIVNRIGTQTYQAEGLTVWISTDGRKWQQLWRAAGRSQRMWLLELGSPIRARYVRIGLDGRSPGYLHLADVRIYGLAARR